MIFATSTNGYVYAVSEVRGEMLWKFPTSEPVFQPPAVIEDHVFVVTQLGGMFCCDTKTGKQLWSAPEISQFVAASKQRVYAADRAGRTQVLTPRPAPRWTSCPPNCCRMKLLNTQTDRLYLATDSGLVQCLHEIEQSQPILHGEDRKAKKEEEAEKPPAARKPKAEPGQEQPRPKATPKPKAPAGEKPAKPAKKPKGKAAKDADASS